MTGDTLKKSILKLAMMGKLVSQNPKDEPVSKLLEKLNKEREKLIKEGKFKEQKFDAIQEDEIHFEIPESWSWIRLGNICQLIDGEKISNTKLPLLEAKYLRGKKEATFVKEGKIANKNDLLILVDGENSGEVFVIKEKGIIGSTFKKLNICKTLYIPYVLAFIAMNKTLLSNTKKGAAIPHLNKKLFFSLLLPLPPIEEQKRIVEKIDKLFVECNKLSRILS